MDQVMQNLLLPLWLTALSYYDLTPTSSWMMSNVNASPTFLTALWWDHLCTLPREVIRI